MGELIVNVVELPVSIIQDVVCRISIILLLSDGIFRGALHLLLTEAHLLRIDGVRSLAVGLRQAGRILSAHDFIEVVDPLKIALEAEILDDLGAGFFHLNVSDSGSSL